MFLVAKKCQIWRKKSDVFLLLLLLLRIIFCVNHDRYANFWVGRVSVISCDCWPKITWITHILDR